MEHLLVLVFSFSFSFKAFQMAVNIIKIALSFKKKQNKLEHLSLESLFSLIQNSLGKAGAYLSGAPFCYSTQRGLVGLHSNI